MDLERTKEASPGTSEQIFQKLNSWRTVTIEIINNSEKFTLANPRTHNTSGYCSNPPPPSIGKNTRGIFSFSKTSGVAHGAVGVLTYQILTEERHSAGELAIMFSVPFDYVWFENWFALGIFEGAVSCDYNLFRQMYYDTGSFTRGSGSGSIIMFTGRAALVKGTMSAGGQSVMKVEFRDEPEGINNFNLKFN